MSAKKKALLIAGVLVVAAAVSHVALLVTGKKINLEITDAN
jgi:hypothetical protein